MGVLTDFFAASRPELAETFRGWLTVADKPVKREVKNPFTGKAQIIRRWEPRTAISDGPLAQFPDFKSLPHCEFKGVDHVKLAKLDALLSGTSFEESIGEISKPALMQPGNDECGLHELPRRLVADLSTVTDERLNSIADAWAQTDELRRDRFSNDDCVKVLNALRDIANAAIERDASMYLYWSL